MTATIPIMKSIIICGNLFNPSMVAYIVRMMAFEVESGRCKNGAWNKTTWPRIHKKFNRYFKVEYTTKQVKAKGHRLKRDYQTSQYLLRHTGFGWNDTLKVPQAPDKKWAKLHMVWKNAVKFKTHTLQHYDVLNKIFRGLAATSKYACTSAQPPLDDEIEEEMEQGGPVNSCVVADEQSVGADDMSTSTRITSSRKGKAQAAPSSANTKKGRSDVYDSARQVISENSV